MCLWLSISHGVMWMKISDGAVPYGHVVSPEIVAKAGPVLTIGLKDDSDNMMEPHRRVFGIRKTSGTDPPVLSL